MSKRQGVTAVRVANVPEDEFEEVIEGDGRPTITSLAEKGRHELLFAGARLGSREAAARRLRHLPSDVVEP